MYKDRKIFKPGLQKPEYSYKAVKTMKAVYIKIGKDVHAKAKIISVLKGKTLNEYLAKAIEKEIEKDKGVLAKIR